MLSHRLISSSKNCLLHRSAMRTFLLGYDNTNIELDERLRTKKIYKKYAPSKAVVFDFESKEGNIAQIFKDTHNFNTVKNYWLAGIPTSLGVAAYLNQTLGIGAVYLYAPQLVLAPIGLRILNKVLTASRGHKRVSDLYLLQNGDQIVLKTYDSVWHKVSIQDILSYKMVDKKKYIEILLNLKERTYILSTKNKKMINFEILDKIMKGVCIQTNLSTSKARPPANLSKEGTVTVNLQKMFRNKAENTLKGENLEVFEEFKLLNIPYCSERDFYGKHKISRRDFISKIKELEESKRQQEIDKLYFESTTKGRNINVGTIEKNIRKVLEKRLQKKAALG